MQNDLILSQQAQLFKAMGHPSRLKMLAALAEGDRCVCELQALIGDDMSTVSRHLSVLKAQGIVTSHKAGLNVIYHLAMPCLGSMLACTGAYLSGQTVASCACNRTDKE